MLYTGRLKVLPSPWEVVYPGSLSLEIWKVQTLLAYWGV